MKNKTNYWKIAAIFLFLPLVISAWGNFSSMDRSLQYMPAPTGSPDYPDNRTSMIGTVMTGEQIGEAKSYCSEGFYLVAVEGTYLVNETSMLMLKFSDDPAVTRLSNEELIGKYVEVTGKYPAQEIFCEALTCSCEDYILVDSINILE